MTVVGHRKIEKMCVPYRDKHLFYFSATFGATFGATFSATFCATFSATDPGNGVELSQARVVRESRKSTRKNKELWERAR